MDMDAKTMLELSKTEVGVPVKIPNIPPILDAALVERREVLVRAKKGVMSKSDQLIAMAGAYYDAYVTETAQIEKALADLENAGI